MDEDDDDIYIYKNEEQYCWLQLPSLNRIKSIHETFTNDEK